MTTPVHAARLDAEVRECCRIMEKHQVRRVPVVDDSGACCGMVSQADLARKADDHDVAEVVRDVSKPGR